MTTIESIEICSDGVVVHDAPKENKQIETMWAYVTEDHTGEGLAAFSVQGQWMPLVFSVERIAMNSEHIAQELAKRTKNKIKLVKFSTREVLKEY